MGDVDEIVSFLLYYPQGLCVECIAWKTEVAVERVEAAIPVLKREFRVTVSDGNCARCLRDRDILSLT